MDFVSFKKMIIFGSEGTGKTSLTSRFENKCFKEENMSASRNLIFI